MNFKTQTPRVDPQISHHFPLIFSPDHMWRKPKAIFSSSISEPWPWRAAPWPTAAMANRKCLRNGEAPGQLMGKDTGKKL